MSPEKADRVVDAMRGHEYGRNAVVIGLAGSDRPGRVTLETAVGGTRIIDMLTGEQLPRIC